MQPIKSTKKKESCISLIEVGPICYLAKAAHFSAFSLGATSLNKAAVFACMRTMWPGCSDFHLAGTKHKDSGCLPKNKIFEKERLQSQCARFRQVSHSEYCWMSVYRKCGNQMAEQWQRRRASHALDCDRKRTMQEYPCLRFSGRTIVCNRHWWKTKWHLLQTGRWKAEDRLQLPQFLRFSVELFIPDTSSCELKIPQFWRCSECCYLFFGRRVGRFF